MDSEDLVAMQPDRPGAMAALSAASDLLESARDGFVRGDYGSSFTDARDSMRIASSALLMRDGYIATTLGASISYLEGRYAGMLPLDSWQRMETVFPGEAVGVMSRFLAGLGKDKKPDKANTEQALAAAGRFLSSVGAILEASR